MHRYFDKLGEVGIVTDVPPHEVTPNAWTNAQNVRFVDNKVKKMAGHVEAYPGTLYPPWFLQPLDKNQQNFWFYASENDIAGTDGSTHATLSRASGSYSAVLDLNWTSALLPGGVVVLNNANDVPQQWTGSSLNDNFSDLANWPAATTARSVRSIGSFLVALDVTEGGVRTPELIRWSERADPGTVPPTWDFTDPTNRSGRTQLSAGAIMDALPLRNSLVIYQEYNIWLMTEIGGNFVFEFRRIFDQIGALSRRCIGQLRNQHVVFAFDDLVLHDGTQVQSVAENRVRRDIFNTIDPSNYSRSYVAINYARNEVWFCYPESGNELPTVAWVWSYTQNTWTKRGLQQASHTTHGVVDSVGGAVTFDDAPGTFDAAEGIFDQGDISGARIGLLIAGTDDEKLYHADQGRTFDGMQIQSFVERMALPLGTESMFEIRKMKYIREVRPEINGTVGGVVRIMIGTRDTLDSPTTWTTKEYRIGIDRKVDFRVSGRIIDIRFESSTNIDWELVRYRVEYRLSGQR